MTPPAFSMVGEGGPLVATAIHAGHDLRPEVAAVIALDDATRRREEDPSTDRLTDVAPLRVVVHRSRFEVDLNRRRAAAVYAAPDEAWGLQPWRRPPPADLLAGSLAVHDDFYDALAARLDAIAADTTFVVLDIHSYNHRRDGPGAPPAATARNPEVDIGTGSLDRARWSPVVERVITELRRQLVHGHRLDVRENVRFPGGQLTRWVHHRYPGRGCALALDFKKTYMDEWTGETDRGHVDQLRDALAAVVPTLLDSMALVRSRPAT